MLRIIDNLKPFFGDNYRRINVREFARLQKISPPTASKLLGEFHKENLLKKESEKNYIYYFANKESLMFIDLSRIFWRLELEKTGILGFFEKNLLSPTVILFGSLSKAEARKDSDIDIAVFTVTKKELSLKNFEKKLKRRIQLFIFHKRGDVKNTALLNNILNGYILIGSW